jgi:hypothetical protein
MGIEPSPWQPAALAVETNAQTLNLSRRKRFKLCHHSMLYLSSLLIVNHYPKAIGDAVWEIFICKFAFKMQ